MIAGVSFQIWRSDALRESAARTVWRHGDSAGTVGLLIATPED